MSTYDVLRQVQLWLFGYATLAQLVFLILAWPRITFADAYRVVGAGGLMASLCFGTYQVITSNVPPGSRIYWVTMFLAINVVGVTMLVGSELQKRKERKERKA